MKCGKCIENKWEIKDLKAEIKELKKEMLTLEDKIFYYDCRELGRTALEVKRDNVNKV